MAFWTYLAQVVNFIVFVLVLHWLLYKPVLRIMAERREAMEADRLAAEEMRREAEGTLADVEKKARDLEEKKDSVLKVARDQARELAAEIAGEAETQGRERLERFRRVMDEERRGLLEDISDDLRDTIVQVASAVLGDEAGRLADRGIERVAGLVGELSDEDTRSIRKALDESGWVVKVHSAAALDERQAGVLRDALCGKLDNNELRLDVEVDPSLVAGVEVTAGHVNLAAHWRGRIDEALRGGRGIGE